MLNENIIQRVRDSFEIFRKETDLGVSYDELRVCFHIEDSFLHAGYVNTFDFSRQLCLYISSFFDSWNNYFQGLVTPSSPQMVHLQESRILSDSDRKELLKIVSESMSFVSEALLLSLKNDKKSDAVFVKRVVDFWNNRYRPEAERILQIVHNAWNK